MHISFLEAVGVGLGFLAIVAPDFWPKMPRALSYTLAGIGFSWLTYSGILGFQEMTGAKLTYGPLAAIVAGAILIAAGLFWHISRIKTPSERPALATTEAIAKSAAIAGPYADNDKGQWSGEKFIFHEPKHVFTIEVTAADNGKQIPFKVNLPPNASVGLSIKIDPLIFDNRNVQAQFSSKDIRVPWDGIARHSMLAFVPKDQTFYLETLKPTQSNASVIKVYMNAWWPPKS